MSLCQIGPIQTVQAVCTHDSTLEKRSIRRLIVDEQMVSVKVWPHNIEKPRYVVKIVIAELSMKIVIIAIDVAIITHLKQVIH